MRDDERTYKLLLIAGMEDKRKQDADQKGSRIGSYQSRFERDKNIKKHYRYERTHTIFANKLRVPRQRRNVSAK